MGVCDLIQSSVEDKRSKQLTLRSDWFRLETLDDSLQPTIDMLLNVAVFVWFGAITPWYQFAHNNVIPIYRLVPLGILVLLLRRLPVVFALHKKIHQIEEVRQALFVGFFGPIGVSAIFYLYVSLEFLRGITVDGVQREDAARLGEIMTVVIWFLAICSIVSHNTVLTKRNTMLTPEQVVHGISIPVGKLGFHIPRTISAAISSDRASLDVTSVGSDEPQPLDFRQHAEHLQQTLVNRIRRTAPEPSASSSSLPPSLYRSNQSTVNEASHDRDDREVGATRGISGPRNPRRIGRAINKDSAANQTTPRGGAATGQTPSGSPPPNNRTIRFPDDDPSGSDLNEQVEGRIV